MYKNPGWKWNTLFVALFVALNVFASAVGSAFESNDAGVIVQLITSFGGGCMLGLIIFDKWSRY